MSYAEKAVCKPTVKVTQILKISGTAVGHPIQYPQVKKPEATMLYVEIPSEQETGWHKHPYPSYAYLLSGRLMIETENGKQSLLA